MNTDRFVDVSWYGCARMKYLNAALNITPCANVILDQDEQLRSYDLFSLHARVNETVGDRLLTLVRDVFG